MVNAQKAFISPSFQAENGAILNVTRDVKPVDLMILCELMKNSRSSDKQIAKTIGISQPTVTRRGTKLEKNVIDAYTTIPVWEKLGYEILAITPTKIKQSTWTEEKYNQNRSKGLAWLKNQPNVIMSGACRGMNADAFMISFHTSYKDYDNFMYNQRLNMGEIIENTQFILANLTGKEIIKPLQLRSLLEPEPKNHISWHNNFRPVATARAICIQWLKRKATCVSRLQSSDE